MKTENARWFLMFSIVAAFTVGRADDVAVSWDGSGNTAESSPIAVVSDDTGAIVSPTASPAEGGTIFINGEPMNFADGATISLATPGSLVFSNDVTSAGTLKVGEDDPDAEISYSGDIVRKSPNESLLFAGKRLSDYDIKSSYFRTKNVGNGDSLLFGPSGAASVECVKRFSQNGVEMMRVLLQQWNGENTFSVELELLQRTDGIAGRVVSGRYSKGMQNLVGCDLQEMYQNDVILSNNVKLVLYQSVADSDTLKNGYGVNQLTLIRRMFPRKAVFAGGVDVAAFKAAKGTELVFSEGTGVSGPFYGSGKVAYGAPAGSVEYGAFLTEKSVVAKDRSIQDIVALSALLGGVNAGSTGRLAQGYHYRVSADGSYATCQFQRIQGKYICCVRVKFEQNGNDIVANTDGARMMLSTVEGVTYDLGIDFYNDWPKVDASGNAIIKDSAGNQYFYYRSIADAHNKSGLALSDLSIEFSGGQSLLTGINAMDGSSRMTVCGELGLTRSVRVTDLGGLPTNGLVTVGQYGILDLNATAAMHGDGISGGGTEIVVYTNGLLRLSKRSVLSTWKQKIRLYGGNWECGYQMAQTASSDHHHYANTLTLSDGARLYGAPPRVGFRTLTPAWRVMGSVPSVCDSGLHLLSWESRHTVFQLYVEDVTGDEGADLYFNGPLHLFESDAFTNITVRKTGDGTFLQNGVSTLKRENELWRGAWVFGKSGVSEGKQEFHLEGGTTLGLAAGVSNGLGKVLVKAPAKLSFSEDTLLTLDELVLDENARLDIEGTFGKRSLHVAASLSESMLSRISCPEGRVMQDDEGYIRPRIKPLVITVR